MFKRLLSLALAAGLIMALAGLATAGVPDPGKSQCSTAGGQITITPEGSAPSLLARGCPVSGVVRDINGLAIPNYPAQDIWLDDTGTGEISLCQGGSTADADTDASGAFTMSGVLSGGGVTEVGMAVYVSGVAMTLNNDGTGGIALAIDVNSPDLNFPPDRIVDTSDIGIFTSYLDTATFDADYNFDNVVDLSDIGLFSGWLDELCP
jgi:hypothetical protein